MAERPSSARRLTALDHRNGHHAGRDRACWRCTLRALFTLRREVCSTCGGSFDSPPCSLNREIGWSGHTVYGGVSKGSSDA